MAIRTTSAGAYPKPPDEGQTFVLRKTLQAMDRGEATAEDVQRAVEDLGRQMIEEQEKTGVDLVTHGHPGWEDILTPFARHIGGFEIGGLLRWFDNNVYYRRPVSVGRIEWRGPSSVDAFKSADSVATKPVKAVIPGPITFARLSIDEYYSDHDKFVGAIAKVLAQEAFELEASGAEVIQIDEPALLDAPEDLALAREAVGTVTGELNSATTILATYFGDAKRLGAELFDLPVDGFALDFVAGPDNFELVKQFPKDKILQAGIVDARNTKLEPVEDIVDLAQRLLESVDADRLWLAPSASLEFLPREKARAKLERLTEAAGEVGA
ncbi:MAG: methylcobamide--CoM methyltransferase [Actinobacteria bacterium]|nr:methylcobamide--CoM methyltransferase [Actinomycetota bacterium]